MPAYEFVCIDCGRVTELRASFAEKDAGLAPTCGACGSDVLRRTFTTVAVLGSSAAGAPAAGGCCGGGCCGG